MPLYNPKALVLTGYGINCDYETLQACRAAGFEARRVHLNDVLESEEGFSAYALVVFPGGFTFGDDLGSGVAFAAKVRFSVAQSGKKLYDLLMEYVHRGGLVLGICNGFQILVRLGIIPACRWRYGEQQATLAPNTGGYFIDRWVNLKVEKKCKNIFTRGMESLRLPLRSGEGRFLARDAGMLDLMEQQGHVCMRYCNERGEPAQDFYHNPNTSQNAIAGISDPSGRVLGIMPHPEAGMSVYQYPDWTRLKAENKGFQHPQKGQGYRVFRNAYNYLIQGGEK
ncbi:MAG: phosphoribosylformylglycinamidine synthase subunit PurQ [Spirochaetota bacterium]